MNEQIIANPTIQDHLNGAPEEIVDLFKTLQKKIFDLDQVEEQPKSQYIGYYYMLNKNDPKLFVEVHIQKRKKRLSFTLDRATITTLTIKSSCILIFQNGLLEVVL